MFFIQCTTKCLVTWSIHVYTSIWFRYNYNNSLRSRSLSSFYTDKQDQIILIYLTEGTGSLLHDVGINDSYTDKTRGIILWEPTTGVPTPCYDLHVALPITQFFWRVEETLGVTVVSCAYMNIALSRVWMMFYMFEWEQNLI